MGETQVKKGCIFDLDGTLLDTIHTIAMYGNRALQQHGLPAIDVETYKMLVGNGAKNLVRRMLAQVGTDEGMFDEVYATYDAMYAAAPLDITVPYDGILELLSALKERGIQIAVLSNKQHHVTRQIIPKFFGDSFSVCLGQREGVAIKPDPVGVFEILKEWNIDAAHCLYIGDTGTDMECGNAAHMETVGVTWGFRKREELVQAQAQHIIDHPMELLSLLDAQNQ